MIYKNLLIAQANEIAQLLDEYVISHNKNLQTTGTFSSLFKNKDYLELYNEIDKIKTNFEGKVYELKEIKEEHYGNFADVSMKFFDALESYFNALFDTVKQLHLLVFRLYETSKGFINNKRKLSWSEYSQLTKAYDKKVKRYVELGDKLNQEYQTLKAEQDDFINDEVEETNRGFIQIPLLIIIFVSVLATSGLGYFMYNKIETSHIAKNIATIEPTQLPGSSTTPESLKEENSNVLGQGIDEGKDPIIKSTPSPIPTYSVIAMIDISRYSVREQGVLNNAYNEFLRTPNLKYMDHRKQNDLLFQIIEKYYAQYKRDLGQEIQQAKEQLIDLQKATATPTPIFVTPTPITIYINPEVETKLAELRQTLQNIENQPVSMAVIEGRKQRAYQDWIKNNPAIYSAILSSRYINDLNAILRAYGL